MLKDTEPPIRYVQKQGLLSLTERWVQKVLLLLRNDKVLPRMKEDKDFDFVVRNTHAALVPALDDMLLAQASNTVKDMEDLQNVALIIAVIQSLVVVPLFSAAVYMNVARLNGNRSSLFTVFLSIPRHLLVRLATASASPEDAEQAQAAMEDLAMMNGGKQGSLFTWKKPDANLGMDRHTQRRVAYLMIPMVLLVGLVFGLHMASYAAITATGDPARDLVATEARGGGVGRARV